MPRFIGIRHRVKQTAQGEARPTQVAILDDNYTEILTYELADEMAELDFVLGRFPVSYRTVSPGEDLTGILPRRIKWRTTKKLDATTGLPPSHVRIEGKVAHIAQRVPKTYEGLRKDDTVAMSLGGSGDFLAYAMSRRAQEIGARVLRIPPFTLSERRGDGDKNDDATLLAHLVKEQPKLFYPVTDRERDVIRVRGCLQARMDAMKARIACEQRIRQRLIGAIFCNDEGLFPEGEIERLFEVAKANDMILQALQKEEGQRDRALAKAVKALEIAECIRKQVEGVGPRIIAAIIGRVIDVRRFETVAKFKAYCGVHVLPDGRLPRQRGGEVANWMPDIRQAFFLFGDQANYRPDSTWGVYLRDMKQRLREKHPEPEVVDGVTKYTDMHILRMAKWRTMTRFAEWLYNEWWRIEREHATVGIGGGDKKVA